MQKNPSNPFRFSFWTWFALLVGSAGPVFFKPLSAPASCGDGAFSFRIELVGESNSSVKRPYGVSLPQILSEIAQDADRPVHVISVAGDFADMAHAGATSPVSDRVFRGIIDLTQASAGLSRSNAVNGLLETLVVGSSRSGVRQRVSMRFGSKVNLYRTGDGEVFEAKIEGRRILVVREFSVAEDWGRFTLATLDQLGLSGEQLTIVHPSSTGLSARPIERESFEALWSSKYASQHATQQLGVLDVQFVPIKNDSYLDASRVRDLAQRVIGRVAADIRVLKMPQIGADRVKSPWGERVLYFRYFTETIAERRVRLPAVIDQLASMSAADREELRVVVFAGNTANAYADTRHSLGQLAFEAITEPAPQLDFKGAVYDLIYSAGGGSPVRQNVRQEVGFDDGHSEPWNGVVFTTEGQFRTEHVDTVLMRIREGAAEPVRTVLLVRPIGDYNETGDIGVAIADLIGIPSHRLLLVRDDLQVPLMRITRYPQSQKRVFRGNNSDFSLLRNLAFGLANSMTEYFSSQGVPKGHEGLSRLASQIVSVADIRYNGHLSAVADSELAQMNVDRMTFHEAVKNSDSVKNAVAKEIQKLTDLVVLGDALEAEQAKKSLDEYKRAWMSKAGAKASPEAIAALKLDPTFGRLNEVAKRANQKLQKRRQTIADDISKMIDQRLSFGVLSIGIRPTEPQLVEQMDLDLAKFVLSPIDVDFYKEDADQGSQERPRGARLKDSVKMSVAVGILNWALGRSGPEN